MKSNRYNVVVCPLFLLWLFLVACANAGTASAQERGNAPALNHVHFVDLTAKDASMPYFAEAASGARMVALGESIHISSEMPLVRLQLLRVLHQQLGFNVLAVEGALIDAWTAQEHIYADQGDASAAQLEARAQRFKRESLFGLWQTAQMQQVLAFVLATQTSAQPMYITSFDSQPGTARIYSGSTQASLEAHFTALSALSGTLSHAQFAPWIAALAPALSCDDSARNDAADAALKGYSAWLVLALPMLRALRPNIHIASLEQVPSMLAARLHFCQQLRAEGKTTLAYQRLRDEHNAVLARALLTLPDIDGAPSKVVLWAHHSHLHYNSLGKAPASMGQHLHSALGAQLYTVGTFALTGTTPDLAQADSAEGLSALWALAPQTLRAPSSDWPLLESELSTILPPGGTNRSAFFLDLHTSTDPRWRLPGRTRLEQNGSMPTELAADFDAVIFLPWSSSAQLDFMPAPVLALISALGWVRQYPVLSGLSLLACLLSLLWGLDRRRRRRKARLSVAKTVLSSPS